MEENILETKKDYFWNFAQDKLFAQTAARLVDGIEDVEKIQDSDNKLVNCFDIFQVVFNDTYFYIINHSVYIKRDFSELYIRIDDIPNARLKVKDKPIDPLLYTVHMNNFYEDVENYCDNILVPWLNEYYQGSEQEDNAIKVNYIEDGAFASFEFLKNIIFKKTFMCFNYNFWEKAFKGEDAAEEDDNAEKEISRHSKTFGIYPVAYNCFKNSDETDITYILYKNMLFCMETDNLEKVIIEDFKEDVSENFIFKDLNLFQGAR